MELELEFSQHASIMQKPLTFLTEKVEKNDHLQLHANQTYAPGCPKFLKRENI